jgi:hypothetical protein
MDPQESIKAIIDHGNVETDLQFPNDGSLRFGGSKYP